ncbi:DUF4160 domain-containing protein [Rhizobium calliandrae]|uniref:DUF4160 domain-containing protein n=2 Tax=Rhizobium calliandrae TaxID=1312182 RepID=A0ABT7KPV9_9HYPH|nr:DUF4160 domain-containing protein [Rhizobium calliandrae]
MGKLVQIGNIIIRVYANNHLPPHFHVITPDGDALVEIATPEILHGKLGPQGTRYRPSAKNKAAIARRVEPDKPPLSHRLREETDMDMPRIESVTPASNITLDIQWKDAPASAANLVGWIAMGGELLAPLKSPEVWKTATVTDYGATVEWVGEDLAIDAYHLFQIAEDQRDFALDDLRKWQEEAGLSNNEAADFLGVSLRTWKNYRAGAPISHAVKMLLRASQRDPLLMHAHYRPRQSGRPKHAA